MKQNKLSLEDCCLTMKQAKELKELGVDFSNNILYLYRQNRTFANNKKKVVNWGITTNKICQGVGITHTEFVETLTNTEMLEMLPKEIGGESIIVRNYEDDWVVEYKNHLVIPSIAKELLRDALFEMIKYLKTK